MATKDDSKKQEKGIAKDWDGSVNSGSGNGWIRKSDVRTETELVEAKITSAKSYSLKYAELRKLEEQALMDGRIPIFLVEFLSYGQAYVVLMKEDYEEMRNRIGTETTE